MIAAMESSHADTRILELIFANTQNFYDVDG
jgi:hypothetical protein